MMKMKKLLKINTFLIAAVLIFSGCEDVLDEVPRTLLTPESFATASGLRAGLTAAYSLNRTYYGYQTGANNTVFGDEFMLGQQSAENAYATYIGLNPTFGDANSPWNDAYPAINTCNGIIDLGPDATGLLEEEKTQLIAEAKFVRANWYFLLTRTYGGATLDLGSGPLRFNQTPTNVVSFAPEAEVMAAVIQDLEEAVSELPTDRPVPAERGHAWAASALHLLAKAYLWRGSMDYGSAGDYQSALDNALELINNRGTYGVDLLSSYADVFQEGNEDNIEILWTIEWNGNQQFNEALESGEFTNNIQNFLFREFYVQDIPGMIRDVENGRPWIRYSPTAWMLDVAFADKINDERYNASFQTVWYANNEDAGAYPVWSQDEADAGYVAAAMVGEPKFGLGDTAYWHAPKHIQDQFATEQEARDWAISKGYQVTFPDYGTNGWFADLGVNDQNKHFPSLSKKFDAKERPIGGSETDPNIGSTRPYIVYRFAETFLVAAEAAIRLGDNAQAVNHINVIRDRANALLITEADFVGAHGDELDFILDERTRELAGEHMRWFDLKRTGKLFERVSGDPAVGTGAPAVYNRQYNNGAPDPGWQVPMPQSHHILRPVPQGAIDAVVGGYHQNLGYN